MTHCVNIFSQFDFFFMRCWSSVKSMKIAPLENWHVDTLLFWGFTTAAVHRPYCFKQRCDYIFYNFLSSSPPTAWVSDLPNPISLHQDIFRKLSIFSVSLYASTLWLAGCTIGKMNRHAHSSSAPHPHLCWSTAFSWQCWAIQSGFKCRANRDLPGLRHDSHGVPSPHSQTWILSRRRFISLPGELVPDGQIFQ